MGKKIFILNCPSGNAGVAKIISNDKKNIFILNLYKKFPEIKKCHFIKDGKTIKTFDINKNKNTYEFVDKVEIDNIYITAEKDESILIWSGDFPEQIPEQKEIKNEKMRLPDSFSFDNFFGGGFEWRRIRGNFLIYNYSILHYVISENSVYKAINRAGYYSCGLKKEENITFIALAIPVKNDSNPYENIKADSYTIKSGKTCFSALCVGIDETGEFFVSIWKRWTKVHLFTFL